MADILSYTSAIADAVYGENVRSAIIGALNAVNDDNESYQQIKEDILEAKSDIETSTSDLKENLSNYLSAPIFNNLEWGGNEDQYNGINDSTGNLSHNGNPRALMITPTTVNKGDRISLKDTDYVFAIYAYTNSSSLQYLGLITGIGTSETGGNNYNYDYVFGSHDSLTYPIKIRIFIKPLNSATTPSVSKAYIKTKLYYFGSAHGGIAEENMAQIEELNNKVNGVKELISNFHATKIFKSLDWGDNDSFPNAINETTGEPDNNGYDRAVLRSLFTVNKGDKIFLKDETYSFIIYVYDMDGTFKSEKYISGIGTSATGGSNWNNSYTFGSTDNFTYPLKVRLVFKNLNGNYASVPKETIKDNLFYYGTAHFGESSDDEISATVVNLNRDRREQEIISDDYPTLTASQIALYQENYEAMMSEVRADPYNKIPIIAYADSHGSINRNCEVFKLINNLVSWNEICSVIGLGDVVDGGPSVSKFETYREGMDYIPLDKRIDVSGNHDACYNNAFFITDPYMLTVKARRKRANGVFCVEDDYFNIRFLAINSISNNILWNSANGRISTDQADFIIEEMSKTDSRDLIVLSHIYFFNDEITARDNTTFTGNDAFIGDTEVKQSFIDMLTARKNKTSGTFTDSDGQAHDYDFSDCKGNYLLSLHGHHHKEGYETKSELTEFLFQSFRYNGEATDEPDCFYFAYIDRNTRKFKCWKNIANYSAWTIDF